MSGVVTILFTDLVGSTAMLGLLGEVRADALRREHFSLLRSALAANGGTEVKTIGDSLMAAFTSPAQAVACAVEIQQRIDAHNRSGGPALGIRIGVNAGEATLEDGDYFGTPVIVARRLCDRADGGRILVSDVVRSLVGSRGGFTFKALGALPLKGIDDPIPACEVAWEPLEGAVPLPPVVASDRTALVGREAERAALRAAFQRTRDGGRRLVLVTGEPGIGKSSLAFDLARDAHAAGATVLYGRCEEETSVPYQPFAEALGHLARHRPGSLAGVDPERIGLAEAPAIAHADPESERFRLFETVRAALDSAANGAPALVVLDDLHWADKPTLMLVRHIVRAAGEARMLLVGTYRDVELDRRHPLAEMLGAMRRENAERIQLRGLTEAEVVQYLERRAGHELDERGRALARALHAETEGNPFFLREIMRHLVESGAIYERDGRWTSDRSLEDVGLPEGVREVIGRRLNRLSDECGDLLAIASVIGRDFDLSLLARVAERTEDEIADLLDEAVRARGVVDEAPAALDRFTFAHALVRETLYEELSTSRRVRLHRRTGEAIEALCATDLGPHLGELAHHFHEASAAGQIDKAVDYARRASARAVEQLAFEEAVALQVRALRLAEGADQAPDPALLCDLLIELGETHRLAAEIPATRVACGRAAEIARAQGWAERLARAALTYGGIWIDVGVIDETLVALIDDALATLPADHPLVPLLYGRLAMEMFAGDPDVLERHSVRAVDAARRLGDPATLAYALIARRHAVSDPGRLDERLAITEEAIALAERIGDIDLAMRARAFRLVEHVERAAIDDADREFDEFFRIAAETRRPIYVYVAELFRIGIRLREGPVADPDGELERRILEISAWAVEHGRVTAILATAVHRLTFRWLRGERLDERALAVIRGFVAANPDFLRFLRAWIELVDGRVEEARASWDEAAPDEIRRLSQNWSLLGVLFYAADLTQRFGNADMAAAIYERGLPYAGLIASGAATALVVAISPMEAVLARCAEVLGRREEAIERYERALGICRGVRLNAEATRVSTELASALLARGAHGDAERARPLVDRALAEAEALGIGAHWVADARALRSRLGE